MIAIWTWSSHAGSKTKSLDRAVVSGLLTLKVYQKDALVKPWLDTGLFKGVKDSLGSFRMSESVKDAEESSYTLAYFPIV